MPCRLSATCRMGTKPCHSKQQADNHLKNSINKFVEAHTHTLKTLPDHIRVLHPFTTNTQLCSQRRNDVTVLEFFIYLFIQEQQHLKSQMQATHPPQHGCGAQRWFTPKANTPKVWTPTTTSVCSNNLRSHHFLHNSPSRNLPPPACWKKETFLMCRKFPSWKKEERGNSSVYKCLYMYESQP